MKSLAVVTKTVRLSIAELDRALELFPASTPTSVAAYALRQLIHSKESELVNTEERASDL